jgi:hypothetical protein
VGNQVFVPGDMEPGHKRSAGLKAVGCTLGVVAVIIAAGAAFYFGKSLWPDTGGKITPRIEEKEDRPLLPTPEPDVETPPQNEPQWEGCWRVPGTHLPMIELRRGKNKSFQGRFMPVWGGMFPFSAFASPACDSMDFAAGDIEWRVHIHMAMQEDGSSAKVDGWIDPSDYMNMAQAANRKGRKPLELLAKRAELEAMSKNLGKRIPLGIFRRVTAGEEEAPPLGQEAVIPQVASPGFLYTPEPSPVLKPPVVIPPLYGRGPHIGHGHIQRGPQIRPPVVRPPAVRPGVKRGGR